MTGKSSVIRGLRSLKVDYDGDLKLAVGRSRFDTSWANQEMRWSDLLARLATPQRGQESLADYLAWPKAQQDDAKDKGGYVLGMLKKGRRTADNLAWSSAISLDADFAGPTLLYDLGLLDYAWALHSTRKHQPGKPRYRVLIPLAKDVQPDARVAIGRRIAADLGIDQFDDTTYEPHRLFYWPSCSSDAEYVFEHQDAPWLDPDSVLARYDDWKDASQWPTSSRLSRVHQAQVKRAGDPLEKTGIVGAFCRAFSISGAIAAFLADVYRPSSEGRYTYDKGSTAGGLVVYDDKWAYSHHGTDPASMQLCNAWDLVRLHRYADLDLDCQEHTPVNRRPSYGAMADWALKQERVKRQVLADKTKGARDDFEPVPDDAPADEAWKVDDLAVDRKGNVLSTRSNYLLILRNDKNLAGRIRLNSLASRPVVEGALPWRERWPRDATDWTDADMAGLLIYLEKTYDMAPQARLVEDAWLHVLEDNSFHPVREWLDALPPWDQQERLDSMLTMALGAEDNPYTRAVSRKTLVAAIARVMRPGGKYDAMLTLKGPQNLGKSLFVRILGGEWASDSLSIIHGKDAYEQLRGTWIIEMSELAALRTAVGAEAIKHFISKPSDRYRPAYGRNLVEFPRQCIFIGSTNEATPLSDPTGGRRFWIVECGHAERRKDWVAWLKDNRVQLFAEALTRWKDGEKLYLEGELLEIATSVQADNLADDGLVGQLTEWLDQEVPADWYARTKEQRRSWYLSDFQGNYEGETTKRDRVCAKEVWVEMLNGADERFTNAQAARVNRALAQMQWGKGFVRSKAYGGQRGYVRPEAGGYPDVPF